MEPALGCVFAAVEGLIDEAVLRRVLSEFGMALGPVFGKKGKGFLLEKVKGYNRAAALNPWVVLIDLDRDAECAPAIRGKWLPNPAAQMRFCVAVRAVESWLLADREQLARYFGVSAGRVPGEPDRLENPKRAVIELARQSRRLELRRDLVPRPGSGREIGPGYTSRMIEFVLQWWRPRVAADGSGSLRRCLSHLGAWAPRP